MEKLHVITCISNPAGYITRFKLFKKFESMMLANPNVELHVCELAKGYRPFEVTNASNPNHLQLRSDDELWHKENMLNLLIRRLPTDWKYVAWVDADVIFARPDWAEATIEQLQNYDVVQMFGSCQDLNEKYEPIGPIMQSMMKRFNEGSITEEIRKYNPHAGHCGYAWAATRKAIEVTGGLLDIAILGSADYHMAWGLIGEIDKSMTEGGPSTQYHENYVEEIRKWGRRAEKLRKNVGYVEGALYHNWHGPKADRGYETRWKILTDHKFNPLVDIERDWQGLHKLVDDGTQRFITMRDRLRSYFRSRNEDAPSKK